MLALAAIYSEATRAQPGVEDVPTVWRAAGPGKHTIRVCFEAPLDIRRIRLRFSEHVEERTQEFALSWSDSLDALPTQLVRQQWNFSPTGSTEEVEDYAVDLKGVRCLELEIVPDIRGGGAFATVTEWRVS